MPDLLYDEAEQDLTLTEIADVLGAMLTYTGMGRYQRSSHSVDADGNHQLNVVLIATDRTWGDVSTFVTDLNDALPSFWPTVAEEDIEAQ